MSEQGRGSRLSAALLRFKHLQTTDVEAVLFCVALVALAWASLLFWLLTVGS